MNASDLTEYLRTAFPEDRDTDALRVDSADDECLSLTLEFDKAHLRPGGTLSGPTMMKMVDTAMYLLVIHNRGEAGKRSVTSSLNIQFLQRPEPADLVARARMLRLGNSLAVGSVELQVNEIPVAFATVTYALPKT